MDSKLYPSGSIVADVDSRETIPTTSDYLQALSGDETKFITIANLFASPGAIGGSNPAAGSFTNLKLTAITTYTASGAIDAADSLAVLASSTPATVMVMTIVAPEEGRFLVITQDDGGTAGHTVTLSSGNFNGGADTIATFNARNETITLLGLSASRFIVISNVDAVSFS